MEVGGSPEEGGVCGGWVGETQTGEENGLEAIIDCWDCVQEEPGLSLARSLSLSHRIWILRIWTGSLFVSERLLLQRSDYFELSLWSVFNTTKTIRRAIAQPIKAIFFVGCYVWMIHSFYLIFRGLNVMANLKKV